MKDYTLCTAVLILILDFVKMLEFSVSSMKNIYLTKIYDSFVVCQQYSYALCFKRREVYHNV